MMNLKNCMKVGIFFTSFNQPNTCIFIQTFLLVLNSSYHPGWPRNLNSGCFILELYNYFIINMLLKKGELYVCCNFGLWLRSDLQSTSMPPLPTPNQSIVCNTVHISPVFKLWYVWYYYWLNLDRVANKLHVIAVYSGKWKTMMFIFQFLT